MQFSLYWLPVRLSSSCLPSVLLIYLHLIILPAVGRSGAEAKEHHYSRDRAEGGQLHRPDSHPES